MGRERTYTRPVPSEQTAPERVNLERLNSMDPSPPFRAVELEWQDQVIDACDLPGARLTMTHGLGSGLAHRHDDPSGRIWALGDRGPNIPVRLAVERFGLIDLAHLATLNGAKIMPTPGLAPTISELCVMDGRVDLVRTISLRTPSGRPLSGLPLPDDESGQEMEPVFGIDGRPLDSDPHGADPEALVALSDGSFWIAEEYGPSLLKVSPDGVVERRWTPAGLTIPGSEIPVEDRLPAAARRRRPNRGFEGLAISPDETRLYVALQSSLQISGEPADSARIWTLDASSGTVVAEHFYPFDPPETFRRDSAAGSVGTEDLKIGEIVCVAADRLLVLERISRSSKIYAVDLVSPKVVGRDDPRRWLDKQCLLSTDDTPDIPPDLEGMALMSDGSILIVNDNDFGLENVATRFIQFVFDCKLDLQDF